MILVVSGTNREGSKTLQLSRHLANYVGQHSDKPEVKLLDLAELPTSLYAPGAYWNKPEGFAPWSQAVLASDGILTVVPEYNGSFPGILKFFIDHLPFPESFDQRPVSFVGLSAGQWGALRAVEQLQHVFGYRNAHVYPRRTFLPAVHQVINEDGEIDSEDVEKRLIKQVHGFVDFCKLFPNPTADAVDG